MRYIMGDYVVPARKRVGRENEIMAIHSAICGNEGIFGIEKERLPELLAEVFGDRMLEGSALFMASGERTYRLPVYYSSDRMRATDAFYGSTGQYMKEYIPEYIDDEETYPTYNKTSQVFVREAIVPLEGVPRDDYVLFMSGSQNKNWGWTEVTGIRLDPRDDFTVEELLAMGTSMETIRNSIETV